MPDEGLSHRTRERCWWAPTAPRLPTSQGGRNLPASGSALARLARTRGFLFSSSFGHRRQTLINSQPGGTIDRGSARTNRGKALPPVEAVPLDEPLAISGQCGVSQGRELESSKLLLPAHLRRNCHWGTSWINTVRILASPRQSLRGIAKLFPIRLKWAARHGDPRRVRGPGKVQGRLRDAAGLVPYSEA